MNSGINIEEVKQFNATLSTYKEKASKLNAKLEFNQSELKKKCEALSKELGVEVTEENVEQIYNEYVAKIQQSLETGKNILSKIIDSERQAQAVSNQSVDHTNVQQIGVVPPVMATSQVSPVPQVAQVTPVAPVPNVAPVQQVNGFASNPMAGQPVFSTSDTFGGV